MTAKTGKAGRNVDFQPALYYNHRAGYSAKTG